MSNSISATTALADPEEDFRLDVSVVEAAQPVAGLLQSTSDNCGSTCSGTACTSSMDYPA